MKRTRHVQKENDYFPSNPDDSDVSDSEAENEANDLQDNENSSEDENCESGWFSNHNRTFEDFDIDRTPSLNLLGIPNKNVESYFFSQVLTAEFLEKIVLETNKYAQEKNPNSKYWNDLTINELKAWLGITILMGIHRLPRIENYWSTDTYLRVDCIANVMPRSRFQKITEMIHVNDNKTSFPRGHPNHDKLHKVRPFIDHLNDVNGKIYNSSNVVSVDESMIPFSGRSSMKQYMPMKPIDRGFKAWCLADSKTGFIIKFDIYTGKSNDTSKNPLGERVVLNLISNTLGCGSLVAFDNYFTSPSLMEKLVEQEIYAVGTVRTNRKGLPEMMKEKQKMERGEYTYRVKESISAIKWMDSKPVTVLSNVYDPKETVMISRKKKDGTHANFICPKCIDIYNKIMGGVDRYDQLRERYMIGRRSKKWWHPIFYWMIDLSIIHSFILYKLHKDNEGQDQLSFRLALAKQLIANYNGKKRFRSSI